MQAFIGAVLKKVHRNDAQRMKVSRTSEVRQARLTKQLNCSRAHLKSQSDNEQIARLKLQAERQQTLRESETAAKRTDHRKRQQDHEIAQNENESKARRISRLSYQRKYQAKIRGNTNDKFHN